MPICVLFHTTVVRMDYAVLLPETSGTCFDSSSVKAIDYTRDFLDFLFIIADVKLIS